MSEQQAQDNFEEFEEQLENEVESELAEQEVEKPQGFKTLEEYVADGGDPAMYRGEKAYEQYHQLQQEAKASKRELREMRESIDAMAKAIKDQSDRDNKRELEKIEARLQEARDNLDQDEFEKAYREKVDHEQRAAQQQQVQKEQRKEYDFVRAFRQLNPVLDANSPDYDPDINILVEAKANQKYQKMNHDYATQEDYEKILKESLQEVTGKFSKQKQEKSPKTPVKTRQAGKNTVETTGTKLSNLSASARMVYDTVLKTSGEEAAKNYLNDLSK